MGYICAIILSKREQGAELGVNSPAIFVSPMASKRVPPVFGIYHPPLEQPTLRR
jgi:hypothetical protein